MSSSTAVIGGGIGGLAAGFYMLRRFGAAVNIYESGKRVGGWIRTEDHSDKGYIFEIGPHTIRPKGLSGANTLQLIEEINMPVYPIPSKHEAARNRMIYAKGQLCPLPNSILGVLRTRPPFSKPLVSALFHDLNSESKKPKIGDESIYDFTKRRFGAEIADYAVSALVCGICAGDAKEISVRFLMEDLFEKEQKWGGVIKGYLLSKLKREKTQESTGIFAEPIPQLYELAQREKWSMYAPKKGLETLPRTLDKYLREHNVNIHTASELKKLVFHRDGVKMHIQNGKGVNEVNEIDAKHVISALPSYKLAPCLKTQHPSLADLLLSIPYVDVAVVNLQYESQDLLKQKAFGFLVPPVERLPILGVIFDSCCFNMGDNTVLTVMMGGKWFDEHFGTSPTQKELLDIALQQIERILGIDFEPKTSRVHILQKCIPQYTVGHQRRVNDMRNYIKYYKIPLSLCGAAYDGVGINDVILSARNQIYVTNPPPF